jgi:hypothetical protein
VTSNGAFPESEVALNFATGGDAQATNNNANIPTNNEAIPVVVSALLFTIFKFKMPLGMVSNMPVEAVYVRTRIIGAELGYVVLPIWDWLTNSPYLPVGAINDNSSI